MANVNFEKTNVLKNMQEYTQVFFGPWGFLLIIEKNVFSQPLPCQKNAVKFVIFFSTINLIFLFVNCNCLFFLIQRSETL